MDHADLAKALTSVGRGVRDRVWDALRREDSGALARAARRGVSDVLYGLDDLGEQSLIESVEEHLGWAGPLHVLGEGTSREGVALGRGAPRYLVILDPIDGTRGLMHGKRSAFFLAAIASVRRDGTPRAVDVVAATMVEIPTARSVLSDVIAVTEQERVVAWTDRLDGGEGEALACRPLGGSDPAHGFVTVNRFVGGAQEEAGAFEDALHRFLVERWPEDAHAFFEDQYISNGGQLHGLATGRDAFVADLRPLFARKVGRPLMTAHPYDLCAMACAQHAGVVVTDPRGRPLDFPLDLTTEVAFVAYANEALRARIEPALQAALAARGLE